MFGEGLKLLLPKSLLYVTVHAKTFCELVGWVILQAPSDLSNPVWQNQKQMSMSGSRSRAIQHLGQHDKIVWVFLNNESLFMDEQSSCKMLRMWTSSMRGRGDSYEYSFTFSGRFCSVASALPRHTDGFCIRRHQILLSLPQHRALSTPRIADIH